MLYDRTGRMMEKGPAEMAMVEPEWLEARDWLKDETMGRFFMSTNIFLALSQRHCIISIVTTRARNNNGEES